MKNKRIVIALNAGVDVRVEAKTYKYRHSDSNNSPTSTYIVHLIVLHVTVRKVMISRMNSSDQLTPAHHVSPPPLTLSPPNSTLFLLPPPPPRLHHHRLSLKRGGRCGTARLRMRIKPTSHHHHRYQQQEQPERGSAAGEACS